MGGLRRGEVNMIRSREVVGPAGMMGLEVGNVMRGGVGVASYGFDS